MRENRFADAGEAMRMLGDRDLVDPVLGRPHAAALQQLERWRRGTRLVRPNVHMEIQHTRTVPQVDTRCRVVTREA